MITARLPFTATWYVVSGPQSAALRAVEPQRYRVEIPPEVLDWSAAHGAGLGNPDACLLVTCEDWPGEVYGVRASVQTQLTPFQAAHMQAALQEEEDARARQEAKDRELRAWGADDEDPGY